MNEANGVPCVLLIEFRSVTNLRACIYEKEATILRVC